MVHKTHIGGPALTWKQVMANLFSKSVEKQDKIGEPGIKKYRAKRKIKNRIAKLSRRANR